MQDDLTKMFNRSMNFSNPQMETQSTRPPPTPTANFRISQHYHHSAHQIPTVSAPPEMTDVEAGNILSRHGIDPSQLSISQGTLFKKADSEQRDRLIELWRISHPKPTDWIGAEGPQETTLKQEEELARVRYEGNSSPQNSMSQTANLETARMEDDAVSVEPYVKSGYEILTERDYNSQAQKLTQELPTYSPLGSAVGLPRSLDPAFNAREWWHFIGSQPMEMQYGLFEQMHHYGPSSPRQEDQEMH